MPLFPVFALPQDPVVAIPLILVVLGVVYAALTLLIKAQPVPITHSEPFSPSEEEESEEVIGDAAADGEPVPTAFPSSEVNVVAEPESPPQLLIDALAVRGSRIAVGDRAATVMRVLRRHEAGVLPVIERDGAGRAESVLRSYTVDGQALTIEFRRHPDSGVLCLSAITLRHR